MSGVGAYLSPVHTGCATPCHAMPFPVPHSLCATPRHSLCPIPCRAGRSGIATGACPDISAPRCQFYTRPRVTPGWPRSCSLVTCPLPPSLSLVPLPIPILSQSLSQSTVSQRWHPGPVTLAPAASFVLPPPSVSRSPRSRPTPPLPGRTRRRRHRRDRSGQSRCWSPRDSIGTDTAKPRQTPTPPAPEWAEPLPGATTLGQTDTDRHRHRHRYRHRRWVLAAVGGMWAVLGGAGTGGREQRGGVRGVCVRL